MKRALIVILILITALPTFAQEHLGDYWDSGCDPDASAVFAPVMGEERYAAACDALTGCMPDSGQYGAIFCEFAVYDALVNQCQNDDDACDFESSFYMASLLIFDPAFSLNRGYPYEPADIQEKTPDALARFQAGDYQAVIDLYAHVYSPETYYEPRSPMLDFIRSLLWDQGLGNPNALSTLYLGSAQNARTPFVTYQRARFLADRGFPDAAGVEGRYLQQLAEIYPLARPAAEEIATHFPFPDALLEDWLLYPVEGILEGATYGDLSMAPGQPIQLAFLSNSSLLIIELPQWLQSMMAESAADGDLFLLTEGSADSYSYYRDPGGDDASAFIQFEGNFATMNWHYAGIMEILEGRYVLGKADEPDPRVERYERCEGGARWRLAVGDYGAPSYGYDADYTKYQYYDAPDGNPVAAFSADTSRFQVTDGPVCVDGVAWWQINTLTDDDTPYWIPESSDRYFERDRIFTYLFHTIPAPE